MHNSGPYFTGTLEEWVALQPEKKEIVIRTEPIFATSWAQERTLRYAERNGHHVAVEWEGAGEPTVIEV
jgi:hypothetical protein